MEYKVSVIMPMYKGTKFIKAAVDGLLHQSLPEVEIIVVDDCSPDDSLEYCRKLYGDNERVQIIAQPVNMGPGEARTSAPAGRPAVPRPPERSAGSVQSEGSHRHAERTQGQHPLRPGKL